MAETRKTGLNFWNLVAGLAAAILAILGALWVVTGYVLDPGPWRDGPVKVTVLKELAPSTVTKEQRLVVDQTNADHKTFGTNTKAYSNRFEATPGYTITDVKWVEKSATRVSGRTLQIVDGGQAVTMTYSLKAGPQTDRYRGWLRGEIVTTEKQELPEREEAVGSTTLLSSGRFVLDDANLENADGIAIRDENGFLIAQGSIGTDLIWRGTCVVLNVRNTKGLVELSARCTQKSRNLYVIGAFVALLTLIVSIVVGRRAVEL